MLEGIIIKTSNFKEKDLIIKILSEEGNIKSGLVKSARSKKSSAIYQIGNLVKFEHIGRESSLGMIKAELDKSFVLKWMMKKNCFMTINSICEISDLLLNNSHNYKDFYQKLKDFLENIDEENVVEQYLLIEAFLLMKTGYYDKNDAEKYKNLTNYEFLEKILKHYNKKMPFSRGLLVNL